MTEPTKTDSDAIAAPPAVTSPQVLPDNRVTFRIYAPNAGEVYIEGDWMWQGLGDGGQPTRDEQGVWSLTVGPLPPDFYTYTFSVDGVSILDPANTTIKPSRARIQNILLVPGDEMAFAATRTVPHGEVRMAWYNSPATDSVRRMHVYTPPGYENGNRDYPVLYLIHGGGDDDAAWHTIGRAGFIMDNLLAAHQVEPMIIVMPNGTIDLPGWTMMLSKEDWDDPDAIKKRIDTISRLHDTFVEDLLFTIMPTVEAKYRVRADRDHRAIAGLSMGGAETLRVAPSNLDKFAYIGVFSMGLQEGAHAGVNTDFVERNSEFFGNPTRTNKMVRLFYIAAGDNDAIVTDGPRRLSATLSRHGIDHLFNETEGDHTWINWRRYLHDFLPMLFQR